MDGNGHYHYPQGYLQVARHWLVRQREPVAHPFMRRTSDPHVRPDLDPSPPSPPRIVPARATAPENL
jgi:hypothetical protein